MEKYSRNVTGELMGFVVMCVLSVLEFVVEA
jgi:hypothetical protein